MISPFGLLFLLFLQVPAETAPATVSGEAIDPQGALRGVVDLEESRIRFGLKVRWPSAGVELERELDGWAGDPRGRQEGAAALRATTDEKGQFRISGLAPGFYTMKVTAGEARPLVRRGVKVEAEGDTVLAEALVLEPPLRLPIRLSPAADPWQRPWKVRLNAEAPRSQVVRVLAEAGTDAEGLAVLEDLGEGEARLEIRDGDGRVWLEQGIEMYPEHPEIFLVVDVVAVEGRLYFGDESLAGDLSFGTTQGSMDIRMASGDDGRFRGYLPKEGWWSVEILWPEGGEGDVQRLRDVEVRRRPGKNHADVEIRIPPTELRGKVVAKGQPARDAGITVVRERSPAEKEPGKSASAREAILLSDAEGRFRLRGLEPGNIWLEANRGRETSGRVRLDLQESSWPTEIVLELEEKIGVRGMVTFGPQPVAGARVLALPSGPEAGTGASYVDVATDGAGQFELLVPAATARLDVLVAAPGLGVEMLEIRKVDGGWPSSLVALESERGTLRCQLGGDPGATDFSFGLTLRKNGATLRWMPMIRLLNALGQLEMAPGYVLFHGLAPGAWQSCLEADPHSCQGGHLPANGELTLAWPHVRGEDR